MLSRPKAIFFDVGNTLVYPSWEKILLPLGEQRERVTSDLLAEAERSAKLEVDREMSAKGMVDQSYWSHVFEIILEALSIESPGVHSQLVTLARVSSNWGRVAKDAMMSLQTLRPDFRLGVISNADGTVDKHLENCGLHSFFEVIVDSGRFGYEKPDPSIFQHAAKAMGLKAEDCLYVGDVYSIDYAGSRNAGMRAVLCDVTGIYDDTEHLRINSLSKLNRLLDKH